MSLSPDLFQSQSSIFLLPSQEVVSAVVDQEVLECLRKTNLDQVCCHLTHLLLNPNHEPNSRELSFTDLHHAKYVAHLKTILSSYFQQPDGKEELRAYFSKSGTWQRHPVLVALTKLYKPFNPGGPKSSDLENKEYSLARFEKILMKRADTDFNGIRLLSLIIPSLITSPK